jgi:hypothetical protein
MPSAEALGNILQCIWGVIAAFQDLASVPKAFLGIKRLLISCRASTVDRPAAKLTAKPCPGKIKVITTQKLANP